MIKIGDDVKCINNFGIWTLLRGHVYRVLDVRDSTIQVTGKHGGTNWYKKDRFVNIKGATHMGTLTKSDVRVGDTVVRISGSGLRVGAEFKVISVRPDGAAVRLQGQGGGWYCMSTFSIIQRVKPQHGVLTNDKVFAALASGIELEYFFDDQWHPIDNPSGVSVQFIKTTQFRKKRTLMTVNGIEVPKNEKMITGGVAYGISFGNRAVFRAPKRQLEGKIFWNNPQDAHEVLVASLKPFNIEANPLNPNLLED